MTTLKLTQIGNSLGVISPKELLAKLKLQKDDELFVTENPLGIRLSGYAVIP
jgi:putative addiction module antidote